MGGIVHDPFTQTKSTVAYCQIQIGPKRCRVSRGACSDRGGVTSSTELDQAGFEAIIGFFEYLGFAPLKPKGQDFGVRPGMASFAQLELIRALWGEYTRGAADEDALNKWLLAKWKVSSLRFLRKEAAQKIITALMAMKSRAA